MKASFILPSSLLTARFVLLGLFVWGSLLTHAQDSFRDDVYIVFMRVNTPEEAAKCFGPEYDIKKVKLDFDYDEPINNLEDFSIDEEAMYGPDCFLPEIKLVYRYSTYVVSLYCSKAVKYKNSGAFTPSSVQMKNDIVFTAGVYDILKKLRDEHDPYGIPTQALLEKFVPKESLEIPIDPEMEKYLEDDDIEEDDLDEDEKKLMIDDDGE